MNGLDGNRKNAGFKAGSRSPAAARHIYHLIQRTTKLRHLRTSLAKPVRNPQQCGPGIITPAFRECEASEFERDQFKFREPGKCPQEFRVSGLPLHIAHYEDFPDPPSGHFGSLRGSDRAPQGAPAAIPARHIRNYFNTLKLNDK
jgi:hypothetical protein